MERKYPLVANGRREVDEALQATANTWLGEKVVHRLRECCRQVEADVVSNSRNEVHPTWGSPHSLYLETLTPQSGGVLTNSSRPPGVFPQELDDDDDGKDSLETVQVLLRCSTPWGLALLTNCLSTITRSNFTPPRQSSIFQLNRSSLLFLADRKRLR